MNMSYYGFRRYDEMELGEAIFIIVVLGIILILASIFG